MVTASTTARQQRAHQRTQLPQATGASVVDDAAGAGATLGRQLPPAGAGNQAQAVEGDERKVVLIVDDEREIRTMLAAIMRRLGYETLGAGDGRAALTLFAAHPRQISVVLLDVNMPVMSGGETLQALRLLDPAVPVLLISGYAESDLGGAQGHPSVAFLQKPFTIAQIQAAVTALVTTPT